MNQGQAEPVTLPKAVAGAPLAIELRHLRYFVALADAGSFTHAAEQMFIAQPTLSQQIRRLEEIVGTQLLQRRREGLQLTKAGAVLLDASRSVLSLVDHEVNRTRQAAGLGRQRLRVVVPPPLPDPFAARRGAPRDDQPRRTDPNGRHPRATPGGAGDLRCLDAGPADRRSAL